MRSWFRLFRRVGRCRQGVTFTASEFLQSKCKRMNNTKLRRLQILREEFRRGPVALVKVFVYSGCVTTAETPTL